jgi:GNAT superfamily N-acetyltransferase
MRQWMNLFESKTEDFLNDFRTFTEMEGGWKDSAGNETTFSTESWYTTLKDVGSAIEIASIDVNEGRRQQGTGQKVMQALCALADKHHVRLTLMADESNDLVDADEDDEYNSDYPEEEHWLQNWYMKLGFDYNGHTGDYGPWMDREPS